MDASGLTVLPGLIDSHAHLISLGDELYNLNISDCLSLDEVINRVAGKVSESEPGEWIIGGRWDHTRWESNRFPEQPGLSEES
ncbi:MAG: amidohydrolase family protein [Bacteroidales bacterium]|nr:amidohydrolase family protein [Bacteroidales bacterium]